MILIDDGVMEGLVGRAPGVRRNISFGLGRDVFNKEKMWGERERVSR